MNTLPSLIEFMKESVGKLLEMVDCKEKERELANMSIILEESRLYKNKNVMKCGTHSSNLFIIFYSKNISQWGSTFKDKNKFFQ